jgi:hypothetical protein
MTSRALYPSCTRQVLLGLIVEKTRRAAMPAGFRLLRITPVRGPPQGTRA